MSSKFPHEPIKPSLGWEQFSGVNSQDLTETDDRTCARNRFTRQLPFNGHNYLAAASR